GLLFPEKGDVFITGKGLDESSVWDIRKAVGMEFQNPDNQLVGPPVEDDVALGLENRGIPSEEMPKRIDQRLHAVGLTDNLLTDPHKHSGGQKQRVAIASVLANSPSVLIMDEATAMLDPLGRHEIMNTVSDVQEQNDISLITITHDLNEVVQADRVIVLNDGEIWSEATPREIFAQKDDLREIGLDVPFIATLAAALKEEGIPVTNEPLNHEELLEDLWTLHSRM